MLLTKRMRLKRIVSGLALGLLVAIAPAQIASACPNNQDSCYGQWGVSGASFNAGGQYACDPGNNLCATQAAGELAVGQTCNLTDQLCAKGGFDTSRPYLEMVVNTPSVDVGVLDASETHVGTATFQVKSYLAQGYQVTTSSPGPKSGSHIMSSPLTPTPSAIGTEQFGMNVVSNSCPSAAPSSGAGSCSGTLGANPSQDPDSSFSFGFAAANYDTTNNYMYQDGNIIAQSASSSGFTLYTISYLFNISNVTPAGTYTMNQSLIATSTF